MNRLACYPNCWPAVYVLSHVIRSFLNGIKNYTWIWPRKLTELLTSLKHNKTLFHINQPYNIPFNGYYYHTLVHILKRLNHSLLGIQSLLHYHKSSYTFHTVILLTVYSTMCPVLELSLVTYLKKKSRLTFNLLYTVMKGHWQDTITGGRDRLLICAVCFMLGCHVVKCNKAQTVLCNISYTKLKVGDREAYSI